MSKIKVSVTKEIAKEILIGNTCYIQRSNQKIITINHAIEDAKLVTIQEKHQAKLEEKGRAYIKIEQLSADNQLVIMKDFIEEIGNRAIRKEVSNALNRKNPVRNFNQVMESNMELGAHWRRFNIKEHQRWVSNFIADAYHYH